MANLSDRLKLLRLEKNITQEQFGKMFGIGKSTVSMYENSNSTPDDELKKKIAEFFNVSLDYLMGVSDIREPADRLVKKAQDTIALHRNDGYDDDLPEEARKEIEDFKKYVRHKYGKKKD